MTLIVSRKEIRVEYQYAELMYSVYSRDELFSGDCASYSSLRACEDGLVDWMRLVEFCQLVGQ